jgi:molecular chaperone GrpE
MTHNGDIEDSLGDGDEPMEFDEAGGMPDELAGGVSARVTELESELAQIKDLAMRSAAEAENIRKRAQRELEDARKYAVGDFAKKLLPVADHLRRAIGAVTADQRRDPVLSSFLEGVEATEREFLRACEQVGLQRVDPEGGAFDPKLHEAMFEQENTGKPAGTVTSVFEPGWLLNGRLLRPARVAVAKAPAQGGGSVDTTV